MHATLESMNEGQSASPVQGNPDDKPSRSSADVPEASRSEAEAGLDPVAEQINPSLSGLDTGGSSQTGALASLLLKISATPIEVVRALEELRALIDERVLRAISAFRTEVRARMDAHDAKSDARMDVHEAKAKTRADAHEAKSKARIDAHEAKSKARADALEAKVDALRREVRLILGLSTLLLVLVVLLVYLSYTNRFIVRNASTLSTTEQVDAPIAEAKEPSTPPGRPAPSTSSASEDVAGPIGDTTTTDGSRHSKNLGRFLAARRTAELAGSRSASL